MKKIYQNLKKRVHNYKNPITEVELSNKFLFVKTYSSAAGISRERPEDLQSLEPVDLGLEVEKEKETKKGLLPQAHKTMLSVSHRILEINLLFKRRVHKIQLDLFIDRENQRLLSSGGVVQKVSTQELGQASVYEKLLSEYYRGSKFVPSEHNKIKSAQFFQKIDKNLNAPDNANKELAEIRLEQSLTEFAFSEIESSITAVDRDIVKASIYEFVFGDKANEKTEEFIEDYKRFQLSNLSGDNPS